MKKRISTPRAATVVVVAVIAAVAATVVPSVAQTLLTQQKAAKLFLTNKKAAKTYLNNQAARARRQTAASYLKKKAASNLYVAKATAPLAPVDAIAAGTSPFSAADDHAGLHPDRVHLVRDEGRPTATR